MLCPDNWASHNQKHEIFFISDEQNSIAPGFYEPSAQEIRFSE